jgi:predicted aldo/keto reductase-like oxidoreductase
MQYRKDKYGNELSTLGFGCMRFPRGLSGKFDYEKSEKLIRQAIEAGVNYFDTAYLYTGSEETLGEILRRNHLREKVKIATKLPFLKVESYADFDALWNAQLAHLQTDTVDYYLIHNLGKPEKWRALSALGIEKWLAEKKERGQIKQIGFSFHGAQGDFLALLEMYPWDFCQIQYNYMNENYQAGRVGLQAAAAKGLPVIVMEPLLGGKLASAPKGVTVEKPATLALKWLYAQPEVTVVLSGMNTQDQLLENIAAASLPPGLTKNDKQSIAAMKAALEASYKIPCTGCNYCMPCPKQVNIPGIFASYNTSFANGYITGLLQYLTCTSAHASNDNFTAHRCVRCGLCESHCPQHIAIQKELSTVTKRMEPFGFKLAAGILHRVITTNKERKR